MKPPENWSQWRESNPRPIDYKSIALPLSYTGSKKEAGLCEIRRESQTQKSIIRACSPDGDDEDDGIHIANKPKSPAQSQE